MIWITGLLTALLVLAADFASASPVQGVVQHALTGLLFLLLAPGFAVFQSLVTTRRWQERELSERRAEWLHRSLMTCNLVVWLFGCVALLVIARWPQVVRQNWQLGSVPLLDELILVLPMLGSILLSWIVIYDAETSLQPGGTRSPSRRLKLAGQRFRTILGMVLVPVSLLFLARDILGLAFPEGAGNLATCLCYMTFLVAMLTFYPLLVSLSWKTGEIEDDELTRRLQTAARESGLPGERIMKWETDGTVVNAIVAGMVPRIRRIFLSDRLLETFEMHEVVAICRHELGHLKLGHLPMRMALILVPLLGMAAWSTRLGDETLAGEGVALGVYWAIVPFAFVGYVVTVVSRFVRKSEIEADLFAIRKPDGLPCPDRAESYCRALLKMAAHSPEMYQRSTMIHPSIQMRIEVIRQVLNRPAAAERFSERFRLEQVTAAAILLFVLATVLLAG